MSRTKTALLWSFGERYVGFVISLASTAILSRLLTPTQVGIYSMCAALTAVAGILRDFGVSEYLIQERDLTEDKIRASFGIAIVVAWSIGACLFVGRNGLAALYGEPGVAQVLAVLSLQFFLLPISSPAFALMNRELAFQQVFIVQVISTAAHSSVSVYLAWNDFGFISLAWGPVVGIVAQTLVLGVIRPRQTFVLPSLRSAAKVLHFGSRFVTSRVLDVLARNFHEPIIAKSFGFASVGLFSRAFGLVDMFHLNVGAAVLRVATPAFAEEHRAGRSVADALARATAILTCISWPFYTLIALLAEPIIAIMFGSQWASAAPVVTILALAAATTSLCALVPQMMSATGQVSRRLQVSLWICPLHIAAILVASKFSLLAIASVWIFSGLLTLTLYSYHVAQTFEVSPLYLLRCSKSSFLVTVACCTIQATALFACRHLHLPALLTIVVVTSAGALAWVCVTFALKHPALMEIWRTWSQLRGRRGALGG